MEIQNKAKNLEKNYGVIKMDNNFEYTNSFVLYESVYKHFLRLSKNSEIATRYKSNYGLRTI